MDKRIAKEITRYNDDHIIYMTCIRLLLASPNIKVFKKQRALQTDHVFELKRHQVKHFQEKGYFDISGTIILAKTRNDDVLSIIDGQHRYQAFRMLENDNYLPTNDKHKMMVELYIVDTEEQKFELFKNINSSEPAATSDIERDIIIDDCATKLMQKFPKAFSDQKTIRRPKIAVSTFKDILIHAKITTMVSDPDELVNRILVLNESYKTMGLTKLCDEIAKNNKANRKVIENNFEKCAKGDYMFLGLFQNGEWVNDLMEGIKGSPT